MHRKIGAHMLILGHTSITLGVAVVAEALYERHAPGAMTSLGVLPRLRSAFVSLSHTVDLRILLVGSLLPDIIDKPVGILFFPDVFGTGRLFCHALIFPLVLAIAGVVPYLKTGSNALFVLAYGSTMHLVLDSMWLKTSTLFWPITRLSFPALPPTDWLGNVFLTLLTNPSAYLPEIAGGILLVPVLLLLNRRGGVLHFLRTGTVD
ncbi:MAG: metal-dependent hydrolase [Dehalococcoidia bacterium]|nr:metal-dependent hydrolase [Dehalococcoidia bacterium]